MRTYLVGFLLSLAVAAGLTPVLRKFAPLLGALDIPRTSRQVHQGAVPRIGGISIVVGFMAPLIGLLFYRTDVRALLVGYEWHVFALFFAGFCLAALGLYDDARGTSPSVKLAVQSVVATFAYALGYHVTLVSNPLNGEPISLVWLSLPITVLWITAIINAVNMLDGLDGLASGVALIIVAWTFAVAWIRHDVLMCLMMACMGGALAGFLVYNFNPASIFMGDTGSMFIGFVLAVSAAASNQKRSTAFAVLVPIVVLGLPITDMVVAVVRRAAGGRPLFAADREHIHHRLLALGLSQRQAVLLLYSVSIVLAAAAFVLSIAQTRAAVMLLGCLAVLVLLGLKRLGYLAFDRKAWRESFQARDHNRHVLGSVRHFTEMLRQADDVDAVWDAVKMIGAALKAERVTLAVRTNGDGDEEERMLSWRRKPASVDGHDGGCSVRLPLGRATGVGHSGEFEVAWRHGAEDVRRDYEIAVERLVSQLDKVLWRLAHVEETPGLTLLR